MAIALDASTPAVAVGTYGTSGTGTTASFTPPANSLVVVMVTNVTSNNYGSQTFTVADSAAGSYALRVLRGPTDGEGIYAGIFWRYYTTSPGAITVTAHSSDTTHNGVVCLTTQVLTGASSTQTGATAANGNATYTVTGNITTTQAGSWVYCCAAMNTGGSNTYTMVAGETSLQNLVRTTQEAGDYLACRETAATGTPGQITMGWTASPNVPNWAEATAEILPAPYTYLALPILQAGWAMYTGGTTTATLAVALNPTVAGNTLVAVAGGYNGQAITGIKEGSGAYGGSQLLAPTGVATAYTQIYASAPLAGGATTATVELGTADYWAVWLFELAAGWTVLDRNVTHPGSAATYTNGTSGAPTIQGSPAIGMVWVNGGAQTIAGNSNGYWTFFPQQQNSTGATAQAGYYVAPSAEGGITYSGGYTTSAVYVSLACYIGYLPKGPAAVAAARPQVAAAGIQAFSGTAAVAPPAPGVLGIGNLGLIAGTGAVTVPAPGVAGSGFAGNAVGAAQVTVPAPQVAAAGTQPVTGTAAVAPPVAGVTVAALAGNIGTATVTPPAPQVAAAGGQGAFVGSSTVAPPAPAVAASGFTNNGLAAVATRAPAVGSATIWPAGGAVFTPPVVQGAGHQYQAGTAIPITLPFPTTAGNTLIVFVGQFGAIQVTSVTLGGSSTGWSAMLARNGITGAWISVHQIVNIAGGQTAVQVNLLSSDNAQAYAYEVPPAYAVLDKWNLHGATATTWTSNATGTTAQASELALGYGTAQGTITGPGSPWANVIMQAGVAVCTGYQLLSGTQTVTYNGSNTTSAAASGLAITLGAPSPFTGTAAVAVPAPQVFTSALFATPVTGTSAVAAPAPAADVEAFATIPPPRLILSLAAAAGTDQYGNIYPQGIGALGGILSGAVTLLYTGEPALGNLFYSNSPGPGTDAYGNAYGQGQTYYSVEDLTNVMTVVSPEGITLSNIDSSGNMVGQTISASTNFFLGGQSMAALIGEVALGVINRGWTPSGTWPSTPIGAETALLELDQVLQAGRGYRLILPQAQWQMTTGSGPAYVTLRIRYTTDGSLPSTSSTVLTSATSSVPSATVPTSTPTVDTIVAPASSANYRLLVTAQINTGTMQFTDPAGLQLSIQDEGAAAPYHYQNNGVVLGSGGGGGGGGQQTYTSVYPMTHTYSYNGPLIVSGSGIENGLQNTDGIMTQGPGPVFGNADAIGNCTSFMLLPYAQIAADLAGATINYAQLRLACLSAAESAITVDLGYNGQTQYGATDNPAAGHQGVQTYSMIPGQILAQTLNASLTLAIANGTATSLQLGEPPTFIFGIYEPSYGGTFYGNGGDPNSQPLLILNYTK